MQTIADDYYYDAGVLRHSRDKGGGTKRGQPVGCLDRDGYLVTMRQRQNLKVHRIIWELHHGEIPKGMQVDHINRVRDDNRIENLRLATPLENSNNQFGSGMTWKAGKWQVSYKHNNVNHYIGRFDCMLDARAAYLRAKQDACKL
jgi:hypothetical protein